MSRSPAARTLVGLAVAAALAAACEKEDYGTDANAATSGSTPSVGMLDNTFGPKIDTVAVGTTVTWTNKGNRAHTTTSDTGAWDSGSRGAGQTFSQRFTQAGTFPYHCTFHGGAGTGMSGTIVVR
jgi:plastocyanin